MFGKVGMVSKRCISRHSGHIESGMSTSSNRYVPAFRPEGDHSLIKIRGATVKL